MTSVKPPGEGGGKVPAVFGKLARWGKHKVSLAKGYLGIGIPTSPSNQPGARAQLSEEQSPPLQRAVLDATDKTLESDGSVGYLGGEWEVVHLSSSRSSSPALTSESSEEDAFAVAVNLASASNPLPLFTFAKEYSAEQAQAAMQQKLFEAERNVQAQIPFGIRKELCAFAGHEKVHLPFKQLVEGARETIESELARVKGEYEELRPELAQTQTLVENAYLFHDPENAMHAYLHQNQRPLIDELGELQVKHSDLAFAGGETKEIEAQIAELKEGIGEVGLAAEQMREETEKKFQEEILPLEQAYTRCQEREKQLQGEIREIQANEMRVRRITTEISRNLNVKEYARLFVYTQALAALDPKVSEEEFLQNFVHQNGPWLNDKLRDLFRDMGFSEYAVPKRNFVRESTTLE